MELDVALVLVLLAVAALLVAAYATDVPYPIWLVVGGVALGFLPGLPDVELEPDLVLVILLPPLLYSAAFFSSLRDLQANLRPIALLAVGLVLFTTVGIAAVGHWVVGLGWPVAFVLGAVLSPTDPVAATAIARRVGAPRRIVTIVEGESLINDSTALIAYSFAVAAVVTGEFSAAEAGGRFVLNAVAGLAIGLGVAWLVAQLRRRIEDPPTEITISLITPFLAYLPAEALGVSAVVAAVSAGIYLGWQSPRLISPTTRIQAYAFWEVLVFLLNAVLFTLVGLQLPQVLDVLQDEPAGRLALDATVVAVAVMAIRFLWIYPATYLPRALSPRIRERDPSPHVSQPTILAWTGMRGAVSLAAALAIPLTVDGGGAFPDRDLVIFLAYVAILATLLLQGLTLPMVIRRLGGEDDGEEQACSESEARMLAAESALQRIEELRTEEWVRDETAERLQGLYRYRHRRFSSRLNGDDGESADIEDRSAAYQRLQREVLEAQREKIITLRNSGEINDEIMRRIEYDLDLEDNRLER